MWISTQSSIRCGGTRLGNSVDTITPVQNQNFSGNRKELAKVLGADVGQPKSHLHRNFPGIWQILWRPFLESLYANTSQIGNKWDCWEGSAQIYGRDFAVLLQSGLDENGGRVPWHATAICETYKISCLLGRDLMRGSSDNHLKDQSFHLVQWSNTTPYLCKRLVATASVRQESHARYIPWLCVTRGREDLERSHFRRRRPWMVKKSYSPVADGTVKLSGKDLVLRTSTLVRDRPDRGEEQGNLLGASDGSSPTPFRDSSLHDGEARNYFWSISGNFIYRHHVEPRVKLYLPREASFPIPLKYIDVTRAARKSLDKMLDKISTIIGTFMEVENCHIRGHVSLGSPYWIRKHRMEKRGPGRRLTRKQTTSRPHLLWPEIWKDMSEASKRRENQKWAIEKPKLDNARKLLGIYFFDRMKNSSGWRIQGNMKNARGMLEVSMPAAMPCTTRRAEYSETCSVSVNCKAKYALHRWSRRIYEKAYGRNSSQRSWGSYCRERN